MFRTGFKYCGSVQEIFKDFALLVRESLASVPHIQLQTCKEDDISCVIQNMHISEDRYNQVRGIIELCTKKMLQEYKGDEMMSQACLDASHAYIQFLNVITNFLYYILHRNICRFFEVSRYPVDIETPSNIFKNIPQIISLLRRNLKRTEEMLQIAHALK